MKHPLLLTLLLSALAAQAYALPAHEQGPTAQAHPSDAVILKPLQPVAEGGSDRLIERDNRIAEGGSDRLIKRDNRIAEGGSDRLIERDNRIAEGGSDRLIERDDRIAEGGSDRLIERGHVS
ncbi:hypothetical protein [Pseudomonas sp. UBA6562]|uniref:hypothetical protein n=1 Tax=Pseudomonas sp. UBA6562 TaxID=1947332 RepID=UPI0025EE809D|nr:hypothetical protein [Pseudomonas sp. UBA6562]